MNIEHIAFWTNDLKKMRDFYIKYFNMKCGKKYENIKKGFSSYFLSFDSGARIEIMEKENISNKIDFKENTKGLTHIAISVGSKEKVNQITEELRINGIEIYGEPRTTGDGYYESVILDPDGNQIEITE